jgi:hypothetical protein
MLGERELQLDEELARGRECLACGRPLEYAAEVEAGERVAERAEAKLALEQEAGRRACAKRVWL